MATVDVDYIFQHGTDDDHVIPSLTIVAGRDASNLTDKPGPLKVLPEAGLEEETLVKATNTVTDSIQDELGTLDLKSSVEGGLLLDGVTPNGRLNGNGLHTTTEGVPSSHRPIGSEDSVANDDAGSTPLEVTYPSKRTDEAEGSATDAERLVAKDVDAAPADAPPAVLASDDVTASEEDSRESTQFVTNSAEMNLSVEERTDGALPSPNVGTDIAAGLHDHDGLTEDHLIRQTGPSEEASADFDFQLTGPDQLSPTPTEVAAADPLESEDVKVSAASEPLEHVKDAGQEDQSIAVLPDSKPTSVEELSEATATVTTSVTDNLTTLTSEDTVTDDTSQPTTHEVTDFGVSIPVEEADPAVVDIHEVLHQVEASHSSEHLTGDAEMSIVEDASVKNAVPDVTVHAANSGDEIVDLVGSIPIEETDPASIDNFAVEETAGPVQSIVERGVVGADASDVGSASPFRKEENIDGDRSSVPVGSKEDAETPEQPSSGVAEDAMVLTNPGLDSETAKDIDEVIEPAPESVSNGMDFSKQEVLTLDSFESATSEVLRNTTDSKDNKVADSVVPDAIPEEAGDSSAQGVAVSDVNIPRVGGPHEQPSELLQEPLEDIMSEVPRDTIQVQDDKVADFAIPGETPEETLGTVHDPSEEKTIILDVNSSEEDITSEVTLDTPKNKEVKVSDVIIPDLPSEGALELVEDSSEQEVAVPNVGDSEVPSGDTAFRPLQDTSEDKDDTINATILDAVHEEPLNIAKDFDEGDVVINGPKGLPGDKLDLPKDTTEDSDFAAPDVIPQQGLDVAGDSSNREVVVQDDESSEEPPEDETAHSTISEVTLERSLDPAGDSTEQEVAILDAHDSDAPSLRDGTNNNENASHPSTRDAIPGEVLDVAKDSSKHEIVAEIDDSQRSSEDVSEDKDEPINSIIPGPAERSVDSAEASVEQEAVVSGVPDQNDVSDISRDVGEKNDTHPSVALPATSEEVSDIVETSKPEMDATDVNDLEVTLENASPKVPKETSSDTPLASEPVVANVPGHVSPDNSIEATQRVIEEVKLVPEDTAHIVFVSEGEPDSAASGDEISEVPTLDASLETSEVEESSIRPLIVDVKGVTDDDVHEGSIISEESAAAPALEVGTKLDAEADAVGEQSERVHEPKTDVLTGLPAAPKTATTIEVQTSTYPRPEAVIAAEPADEPLLDVATFSKEAEETSSATADPEIARPWTSSFQVETIGRGHLPTENLESQDDVTSTHANPRDGQTEEGEVFSNLPASQPVVLNHQPVAPTLLLNTSLLDALEDPAEKWTPFYSVHSVGSPLGGDVDVQAEQPPERPWTPSYSVHMQGSPRIEEPPTERPWTPSYSVHSQGSQSPLDPETTTAKDVDVQIPVIDVQEEGHDSETTAEEAPARVEKDEEELVTNALDPIVSAEEGAVNKTRELAAEVTKVLEAQETLPEIPQLVVNETTQLSGDILEGSSSPHNESRPKSPSWVPSYSISVQGSPVQEHANLPNVIQSEHVEATDVPSSHESRVVTDIGPSQTKIVVSEDEKPNITISQTVPQDAEKSEFNSQESTSTVPKEDAEVEYDGSPWTASYSVTMQGPASATEEFNQISLNTDGAEVSLPKEIVIQKNSYQIPTIGVETSSNGAERTAPVSDQSTFPTVDDSNIDFLPTLNITTITGPGFEVPTSPTGIFPRKRLTSAASSRFFPGAWRDRWHSTGSEGRTSLEVARGEFTPVKGTYHPDDVPDMVPEPAEHELEDELVASAASEKNRWCVVM